MELGTPEHLNVHGDGWVEGRYFGYPLKKDQPKPPKIDKRKLGHVAWNKGKAGTYKAKPASEERKRKISEANKGKVGSNLGKHFSQEHKDRISKALLGKPSHKQTEETRKLISEAGKGRTFWNNGFQMKFARECPGDGWIKGRLKNAKAKN